MAASRRAHVNRSPVGLIWSVVQAIRDEKEPTFKDMVIRAEEEWMGEYGADVRLEHQMPTIHRGTLPARNVPRQSNRIRGEGDDQYGARHDRMVIFTDQYRFGRSTYETRQPGRPSEHHMRAKFDGPLPNNNTTGYRDEELLAARLYLYAWSLAELFNDGGFDQKLKDASGGAIVTMDPVNILPEVSEIQEEIIELPTVNAVALNFTVYTD